MKFRIRRLAADAVDFILCVLCALALTVLPAFIASGFRLGKTAMLILAAAMTFIFFLFRDFTGRSMGKRLFGLKIVGWDGKSASPFQRLRRNLSLLLFPIEILLIIAGYDTLGDSLALTCVVEYKSTGVPRMRKGNNFVRKATLALLFTVAAVIIIIFAVKSLRIMGSAGYNALNDYMSGVEIAKEYGEDPIWKIEGFEKEGDEKIIYRVTINGKTVDIIAVKIEDEWFVYGVQRETVEKLASMISKIARDNTERFSLVDMDKDGEPELLEYFEEEQKDYINVYLLGQTQPAVTLETDSYAGNLRGSWNVYQMINDDKTKSYCLIGIYASYSTSYSEKNVCMVTKKGNVIESRIVFKECVETKTETDEEGENITLYEGVYNYNDIAMAPGDYFSNYNAFFNNYTPISDKVVEFVAWERDADLDEDALIMAVTLMKEPWEER